MAARKGPHYVMSAEHRDKIKNSNILNALVEHVEGRRDMSATQVSAGLGLLRKVLPDLAAVDHSGEVTQNITGARWLTEAESLALTTIHDPLSEPSTIEPNDGLASWPIDGQERQ